MPNWCNNNITITGPNKIIDKIEKITKKDKPGLLNYFHPMPKGLRDTTADGSNDKAMIKKYGYSSWYDWAVENWSTKWDVCEFHGVERRNYDVPTISVISFGFDSAWAPPIGAYQYWISENSNCSIRATYYEGGCDFMGIWDNGDDICYEISSIAPKGSTDKFWTSAEGKELDDLYGITESMAEYEAQQEEEKEDVHEYTKGQAMNMVKDL